MSKSIEFTQAMQEERQEKKLTHEDVALRAYLVWQQKGCPEASAEEDWRQAEEELEMAS